MPTNDPIATAALGDVLQERVRHSTDLGYNAEHDDALPIDFLPRQASNRLTIAQDRLAFRNKDFVGARKALVQATALALAAIDRLDRAIGTPVGRSLFDDPPGEPPLSARDWHG